MAIPGLFMTAIESHYLREWARRIGTEVGRLSAESRGLDDWDAEALDAAVEAERLYLQRHGVDLQGDGLPDHLAPVRPS